jgi:hypothetical protein
MMKLLLLEGDFFLRRERGFMIPLVKQVARIIWQAKSLEQYVLGADL